MPSKEYEPKSHAVKRMQFNDVTTFCNLNGKFKEFDGRTYLKSPADHLYALATSEYITCDRCRKAILTGENNV